MAKLTIFYGMIILVKTKPLCKGMAWLPFQKLSIYKYYLILQQKVIKFRKGY